MKIARNQNGNEDSIPAERLVYPGVWLRRRGVPKLIPRAIVYCEHEKHYLSMKEVKLRGCYAKHCPYNITRRKWPYMIDPGFTFPVTN